MNEARGPMLSVPLGDRLAGGVWGALVGDALGAPYEFRRPSELREVVWGARGTHRQPPGTWTDDGSMLLALLDSLLPDPDADPPHPGGFDPEDQGRRYLAWRRGRYWVDGKVFDEGGAIGRALDRLARGVPAEQAGGTGELDQANGSLMRTLPVALVGRELSVDTLVVQAHRASSVTHGLPRPKVCCALYVLIAQRLLRGEADRGQVLEAARADLRRVYERQGDEASVEALDFLEAYPDRGGGGRVWDAFWSAWDAFAGAGSYEEAVVAAVRYGNDTDTTACICGGLAGVYWGVQGIPRAWRDGMRGRDIAEPIIERLLATAP